MRADFEKKVSAILSDKELLDRWISEQMEGLKRNADLLSERAMRSTCVEFLQHLKEACSKSDCLDISSEVWQPVKSMLTELSTIRAGQGFTPSETATFVFSLKQPIFEKLAASYGEHSKDILEITRLMSNLLDKLGLFTTEIYQKSREEVIRRQQKDILEMSTPVIKLWDGVLAVPLIGTLDSARTQTITEALLQEIMTTGSRMAILDITGVPTVDTQTAQHLIKTVSAARLMGADCIISGIRPQIAQTIVHLGIDISDISTKATMADAVREAFARSGWEITKELVTNSKSNLI